MSDPSTSPMQAVASSDDAGERLDRWLARRFPEVSRARFQRLIADGHVSVEGRAVIQPRRAVKAGETIVAILPAARAAESVAEAIPLAIVHEDGDIIVIDKPAGLVVHPGAGRSRGTLVNALIAHCGSSLSGIGGTMRPGIVHRLDKDTSGLLVVAKNDAAHQGLSEQFAAHGRDGRLERAYLALVWGQPGRRSGTVAASLARSSADRRKMAVSASPAARKATTHYDLLEAFPGTPAVSLLRCRLETGRTHQIRVHMAHIGHPLLGDPTYGMGFAASARRLAPDARHALTRLGRQALHAAVLGFEHPRTGNRLRFESPLPADMARLGDVLRRSNSPSN